ncbi:MAG: rane protein [Fibrobacteres bacterium]|nr:rane protein [Fibrobacterota bacterium]
MPGPVRTIARGIRGLVAMALVLAVLFPAPGSAHEVRPAFLDLHEEADGSFSAVWKQPRRGEAAIKLVPHISNGWLESPPAEVDAGPAFAIKVWKGLDAGPEGLEGRTLSVEGLENTLTDVLVRVSWADGRKVKDILRPSRTSLRLEPEKQGLPVAAYLRLGVEHILTGTDHLLFVTGLLLLVPSLRRLAGTITAFTAAHSLTLSAAALGFVRFPGPLIEALVAMSIVFLAVELVGQGQGRPGVAARAPWLFAFAFGLLHGLAFAGALAETGLPKEDVPLSLLLFNLGVEAGQLLFVSVLLSLAWALRRAIPRLPAWTAWAPAYGIGSCAAFWFLQRALPLFR